MKSFPRYRIYAILGWLIPILVSFYLARLPKIHWAWKILLFLFLFPIVFFLTVAIYVKVGKLWNRRQRKIQKDSEKDETE